MNVYVTEVKVILKHVYLELFETEYNYRDSLNASVI